MPRSHDEYDLCRAIHQYLEARGLRHHHSPAECTDAKRAAQNKAIGTSKGFPDFVIFGVVQDWPKPPHPTVVALEVKTPNGRLTKEQREWLGFLQSYGWWTYVVRSMDEAIAAIGSAFGKGGLK